MDTLYKIPRLYLNLSFSEKTDIPLDAGQAHYLRNVLRKAEGDSVRVFNGHDGEWLARLVFLSKKSGALTLTKQLKVQPEENRRVMLYFSPIKKNRMDILIEKAVELGVSELVPVIMNRSEVRKINEERMCTHIIEAAEQCERMDVPVLHPQIRLEAAIGGRIFVCLERMDDVACIGAQDLSGAVRFMVGPEGGFDEQERALLLGSENVIPIHLGERILRSETACIACLSYICLSKA